MPDVLRPGVLTGVSLAFTNVPEAVTARLAVLGAGTGDEPDVVVARATDLQEELDAAWAAVRDAVAERWAQEGTPGGRVVLIGTPGPVGAALENLARTLATEWARYGVRVTTIVGGSDDAVAELVAFLASPAGEYYTGATFSLTA